AVSHTHTHTNTHTHTHTHAHRDKLVLWSAMQGKCNKIKKTMSVMNHFKCISLSLSLSQAVSPSVRCESPVYTNLRELQASQVSLPPPPRGSSPLHHQHHQQHHAQPGAALTHAHSNTQPSALTQ